MSNSSLLDIQQSLVANCVPGFWKLTAGRALSLQPRQAGVLRIAQGQVWATFDTPPQGHGNESGDHFLQAGQQLDVQAGQRLVFEPLARDGQQAAFFEWTPAPERSPTRALQNTSSVTQPLRDLGLALGMVGTALVHLCAGLLAYGRQLVSGQPVEHAPHCG